MERNENLDAGEAKPEVVGAGGTPLANTGDADVSASANVSPAAPDAAAGVGETCPPVAAKRPGIIKRLYAWVLHWAETPYGLPVLCGLAFIESSFFPIPPDVLLIALCMGLPKKSLKFACWCTLFSTLGGGLGYLIGFGFYEQVGARIVGILHYEEQWKTVCGLYGKYDFWAVVFGAFTPLPYKVFTIAAGMCKIDLVTFMLASAVGRGGRFFLVAGAIFFFGPPVKRLLDKYLELFCLAFMVLLVGSFVLLKYLF